MAPHLPIPMLNVPGAQNYGDMSGNAFLAGSGSAPTVFGAQSVFMHSPRSFVMANYYVTPYNHHVPYDSSAVGAQQHPLTLPGAASNGAIPPTAQLQAAEAVARATQRPVNLLGTSIPEASEICPGGGGYGGHCAAVSVEI
jgi:hypothetical protein